jgi:hypothetical protein
MTNKKYSAGAVKFSFWFSEFRKIISLLQSGESIKNIKELVENDNVLLSVTPMRSKQIFTTVSARIKSLCDRYIDLFMETNLETQKLIALISIMKTDLLFCEFMNEVYREKLIVSDMVLSDADIRVFFNKKQHEDEKVAGWTDATLNRLGKTYKVYLTEAGLLKRGVGDREIIQPLLDNRFEHVLVSNNSYQLQKILTGAR